MFLVTGSGVTNKQMNNYTDVSTNITRSQRVRIINLNNRLQSYNSIVKHTKTF